MGESKALCEEAHAETDSARELTRIKSFIIK